MRHCPRCLREYALAQRFCPFDGEKLTRRAVAELVQGRPSSRQGGLFAARYAVRGLLGRGAMTQVLLGEDVFSREPVAIKVLDPAFLHRPEVVERFTREAEALSRLKHPNVVRGFVAGVGDDSLPFHVLEHLQGESLDELLQRERTLHPRLATRLLMQIASALAAVHEAGVIHRDVKPANLMLLGQEGMPLSVKLVDFGFAHLSGSSVLTPPGTALGTVAYIAPEQMLGDHVDGRSDLYALGILAFRMLTGALPFEAEGVDMMARQLIERIPALSSRVPDIDPRLERIVAAATRKPPDRRYPDARAMSEDLERVLGLRDGPLLAESLPALDAPFIPRAGLPRQVAHYLYGRLGLTALPWGD